MRQHTLLAGLFFLMGSFLIVKPTSAQETQPVAFWVSMPYQQLSSNYTIDWVKTGEEMIALKQKPYRITINDVTGEISGTLCNNFRGHFQATMGGTIKFGPLMSTKKMCVALADEDAVLNALSTATDYVLADDSLILYQDGKAILQLSKHASANAEVNTVDGNYKIKAVLHNESLAALENEDAFFTYDRSMQSMSGKALCNRFFGNASFEMTEGSVDGKLHMGTIGSTMMACPNDELEQAIFKALQSADSFIIQGKTLKLKNGDNTVMVLEQ